MAVERDHTPIVVKVGGSLYDLPDLGARLRHWLRSMDRLLLVPGGGAGADIIRALDTTHQLGEEMAHRLALQVLHLNAHMLAAVLRDGSPIVMADPGDCAAAWDQKCLPILDVEAFARTDQGRPGCLPHTWDVTSDSLAARAAVVMKARQLVLLKSVTLPDGLDWTEAGRSGLVDRYFARVVADSGGLEVCWVNFRTWQA